MNKNLKVVSHLSGDEHVEKFNAFGSTDCCYEYLGTVVKVDKRGRKHRMHLIGDNLSLNSHIHNVNKCRTDIDYEAEKTEDKDFIYVLKKIGGNK